MSFLSLSKYSQEQIHKIFKKASDFKKHLIPEEFYRDKVVAHLFFEASTRTRMSFEMATFRLGARSLLLNSKLGSSLEKEESLEDTVFNIASMLPDALVIRCGDDLNLSQLDGQIQSQMQQILGKKKALPIINAGWGKKGHPTQALLDILTILEMGKSLAQERILFVGDIKHSRVVSSHCELAKILGYHVGFCGPREMIPDFENKITYFENLESGMTWATAVMALRVQLERHQEKISLDGYVKNFQINSEVLRSWKKEGLLMHPGPVNYGVELHSEVLNDSRCVILNQVTHGVYLRMALLDQILKGEL